MTPEQLKVIADHMGVEDEIRFYRALESNDLAMDIMCKLGISICVDSNGEGRYATVWDTDIRIYEIFPEEFTDINHAAMIRRLICKAAYEYLKEKDNV